MARSVHVFVGDKVETPIGEGSVEEVYTWRDKIEEMSDFRAVEFSQNCIREVGENYQKIWAEVVVKVKGRMSRFLVTQIKVLEGRDARTSQFNRAAAFGSKRKVRDDEKTRSKNREEAKAASKKRGRQK